MATTSLVRAWWTDWWCINTTYSPVTRESMFGRYVGVTPTPAAAAWDVLEQALTVTGYTNVESAWITRNCPTGIGGKTCQETGYNCSLHNYGVAVDLDPYALGNPYFRRRFGDGWDFDDCKFTREQIEAVEAVRTVNGREVFKWLGWSIGDTMHIEITCAPWDLATGFDRDTIPGDNYQPPILPGGDDVWCEYGDRTDNVKFWQRKLSKLGFDVGAPFHNPDGIYGDKTKTAVQAVAPQSDGMQIGWLEGSKIDIQVGLLGKEFVHSHDDEYAAKVHSHDLEDHQHGLGPFGAPAVTLGVADGA